MIASRPGKMPTTSAEPCGSCRVITRRLPIPWSRQALDISRDIGDRAGEAGALNVRGTLHRISDDLARAERYHQQALDLARQIGSSWDEAHALAGLGRCPLAADQAAGAEDRLRQALEIFRRIGAAEFSGLSAELRAITDERPTAQ